MNLTKQFNPTKNVIVKGYTKREVIRNVIEKSKNGWEPIHPIKKYLNSNANTVYYITMKKGGRE